MIMAEGGKRRFNIREQDIGTSEWKDWRWQLRACGNMPVFGSLPDGGAGAQDVVEIYPWRATPYYLSLAAPGNAMDPIFRQCMPDKRELEENGGREYYSGPFGEIE